MKPIQAGKMRSWVRLEKPPDPEGPQDAYAEPTGPVRKVIEGWAEVVPQSSREFQQAMSTFGTLTHIVKMRWVPGVKGYHHLLLDGRQLNLLGPPIDEEERHARLIFYCVEAET